DGLANFDLDVLGNTVARDQEAYAGQEMLVSIVGKSGNAGQQAVGQREERLLQGCAWVRQFDVIPDEDAAYVTAGGPTGHRDDGPLSKGTAHLGPAGFCEDTLVVSTMPLRVVVVDDHEVVRNGIKSLLEGTPDVTVVGEAGTVKEAIARVEWARPDVVIMDIRLPDGSGIEATRGVAT